MLDLIIWLVVIELIGFGSFPITYHFFRTIPGRGYGFSKSIGWLLTGFVFWLLASLGLIQNTFGAIASIALLVAVTAWWLGRTPNEDQQSPQRWLATEWKYVVIIEAVFLVSFFAFAYYRAFNPQIDATEKPMEFMFLNSILRSTSFPPHDAWLSGFGISYYYFGYVLVAMLTRLTGVESSVAFNLGLTTVFATSACGAFTLGYSLAQATSPKGRINRRLPSYLAGTLAVFLLLVVGNLEGAVESLHSAGIVSSEAVRELDINNLDTAPVTGSYIPTDNWWWWRASRVVNDHNPRDQSHVEVIDEFPFFSFLLGDLHPHVISIPFTMLALGLAFEILHGGAGQFAPQLDRKHVWRLLLTGIILGAFGFLNSWDLPTYGFVLVAVFALAHLGREGPGIASWLSVGRFASLLAIESILFYLPFYLGFQSQARGLMPVVPFKTSIQQFAVMFGLFLFVLGVFVIKLIVEERGLLRKRLGEGIGYALALLLIPIISAVGILVVVGVNRDLQSQIANVLPISAGSNIIAQQTASYYVSVILARPWVSILLIILIATSGVLIQSRFRLVEASGSNASLVFALLLVLTGFLLTFGVEYVYIRDTFETRMNTVFKLYYQAWTLFAIAAAFSAYYLIQTLSPISRSIFVVLFALLFGASMVYPILAAPSRTNDFKWQDGMPTLDGMAFIQRYAPDEYTAIDWLNNNAQDDSIILEAPGPQYSEWDRFSMATGLPTVLGWAGHELQWRGNSIESGRREPDIEQIYTSVDMSQTQSLVAKYNIRYVVLTPREQQKYNLTSAMIDKFKRFGKSVFAQGSVQIFQVR